MIRSFSKWEIHYDWGIETRNFFWSFFGVPSAIQYQTWDLATSKAWDYPKWDLPSGNLTVCHGTQPCL
jgi:hypothetical protein